MQSYRINRRDSRWEAHLLVTAHKLADVAGLEDGSARTLAVASIVTMAKVNPAENYTPLAYKPSSLVTLPNAA